MLSMTVTVALQTEEMPVIPVTVSVAVLVPTLEQVNEEGETVRVMAPQLSVLPESIIAAVSNAFPVASRMMVAFLHRAIGGVLSMTVTVALQTEEMPVIPVTVSVAALAPILEQVNEEGETVRVIAPQLSVLPESIIAAVSIAFPEASRAMMAFLHLAIGGMLSITVTVAV